MTRLEISLLGPFRVTRDRKPVTQFEADTARALLAYLALHTYAPCRQGTLAGLLWPELPEAAAWDSLRQAVSHLRQAFGDRETDRNTDRPVPSFLLITRQTVQLDPESDYWVDVNAFDDLIAACEGHRHRRLEACRPCMQRLGKATDLYRGDFMSGFSLPSILFVGWLIAERERRHYQALDALHHLAAYHERCGEYEQAQGYARWQLALEPRREEAHRHLMRVLALNGQRAAALTHYETYGRALSEELGLEPESGTTVLYERLREGDLDVSRAPAHNLPVSVTPFEGRERETAETGECLADPDCRLLTLVGPGGIGKTRLALQVAMAQADAFEHGVSFVSLAPLQSADAVVSATARVLGLTFSTGSEPRQQLLDLLRPKSMLLVLDNYEHLLDLSPSVRQDSLGLVADILGAAPHVSILVTSRQELNLRDEQRFHVTGMTVPERAPSMPQEAQAFAAVRLFLHGAQRIRPGFELTADNAMDVVRICQLVAGVPLAIELAAGLVQALTPAKVAAEIERSLDAATAGLRDVPERYYTIRTVFEHTWKQLSEREREAFQALSVFYGEFTQQAARRVARTPVRELEALVSKAMLQRTSSRRYGMHELMRQYAAEKLQDSGRADRVRTAHSAYYAEFVQRREADLKGRRQQEALAEVEAELGNVLAAWGWALQKRDYVTIHRAMEGLTLFCVNQGFPRSL